ncbi:MAG: adenosylcobinamide-GDP ribazoletransferase [Campylobacterota bacterium]|nr:adenosylcobinamide-GDP ribazoletransferase [Campylobacterota bacterium]
MSSITKGLVLAFSMLSTLPFLHVHSFFKGINGYAVMFYPVVGLTLGTILLLASIVFEPFFGATHSSLLVLALWVGVTGALHLDGFSDTIDALFVSKIKREAVRKDPNIGAMGLHFSVIFLLLKASALWHLDTLYTLPFIMMLARYNATIALHFFEYGKGSGMASLAKEEFTNRQFVVSTLFIALGALLFQNSLIIIFISLLYVWIVSKWLVKKFGALNGDGYGFVIETTELLLLHVILIGIAL